MTDAEYVLALDSTVGLSNSPILKAHRERLRSIAAKLAAAPTTAAVVAEPVESSGIPRDLAERLTVALGFLPPGLHVDDAAPIEAEAQKAVAPELCPYCDGSGESTARSEGGPDAWDEPCVCPRCKGEQTLRAAYNTLAEELPPLQLKAAQLGIFHSHATRYGWAPNQTTGMESFAKLAAQWLAENEPTSSAIAEVAGLTDEEVRACMCSYEALDRQSAINIQRALAKKNGLRMGGAE